MASFIQTEVLTQKTDWTVCAAGLHFSRFFILVSDSMGSPREETLETHDSLFSGNLFLKLLWTTKYCFSQGSSFLLLQSSCVLKEKNKKSKDSDRLSYLFLVYCSFPLLLKSILSSSDLIFGVKGNGRKRKKECISSENHWSLSPSQSVSRSLKSAVGVTVTRVE